MSAAETTTGTTRTTRARGQHSCVLAPHVKSDLQPGAGGKYGRMFGHLARHECDEEALRALGRSGSRTDAADLPDDRDDAAGDNPCIPAGWPIFGQFIAHDITADRSLLQRHTSLGQIRNARTPALNLESLYGAGPSGNPYLYDIHDDDHFLLGENDAGLPNDLPRNAQGRALIADPRDDVHLPISQLHLAFLKFHNALVGWLREQGAAPAEVFARAQRLTRWSYQWIVTHEFLPLAIGDALTRDVLEHGSRYLSFKERVFIPVEFADAAYRFGHSQIRAVYQLNAQAAGRIFPDLAGARPVPQARVIDWRYLFALDDAQPPQPSRRIDARLAHPLIALPETITGATNTPEEASLAYRDLQRAQALALPSGEAVARAMGVEPLPAEVVGLQADGWRGETPLWYYILKESEALTGGVQLGPVGGRIVAETLIGLLDADPDSYRNAEPAWAPPLPTAQPGTFTLADLLRFAGVA